MDSIRKLGISLRPRPVGRHLKRAAAGARRGSATGEPEGPGFGDRPTENSHPEVDGQRIPTPLRIRAGSRIFKKATPFCAISTARPFLEGCLLRRPWPPGRRRRQTSAGVCDRGWKRNQASFPPPPLPLSWPQLCCGRVPGVWSGVFAPAQVSSPPAHAPVMGSMANAPSGRWRGVSCPMWRWRRSRPPWLRSIRPLLIFDGFEPGRSVQV